MATKKRTLTRSYAFPFVESFDDYHDIEYTLDQYKEVAKDNSVKIIAEEVAFDGAYYGLFYIGGERPSEKETLRMLKKQGFNDGLDHSDFRMGNSETYSVGK